MKVIVHYLGLDVHKETIAVAIAPLMGDTFWFQPPESKGSGFRLLTTETRRHSAAEPQPKRLNNKVTKKRRPRISFRLGSFVPWLLIFICSFELSSVDPRGSTWLQARRIKQALAAQNLSEDARFSYIALQRRPEQELPTKINGPPHSPRLRVSDPSTLNISTLNRMLSLA